LTSQCRETRISEKRIVDKFSEGGIGIANGHCDHFSIEYRPSSLCEGTKKISEDLCTSGEKIDITGEMVFSIMKDHAANPANRNREEEIQFPLILATMEIGKANGSACPRRRFGWRNSFREWLLTRTKMWLLWMLSKRVTYRRIAGCMKHEAGEGKKRVWTDSLTGAVFLGLQETPELR